MRAMQREWETFEQIKSDLLAGTCRDELYGE
jgi:hypothetical protein